MADQLTIYDMREREDARVELRQLPALVAHAIRLVLHAGRREFSCRPACRHLRDWRSPSS